MILTEEEAKTKTCPHLRYCENTYQVAADRDPPVYSHQRCEGSGCMAWRWSRRGRVKTPFDTRSREDAEATGLSFHPLPDLGYCGLSGRPEGS